MVYHLCWHLGVSQGDIANTKGENVDWENHTVSFVRKKTDVPMFVLLGVEALNLFKDLPAEGALFPYLPRVRANDRATEFRSRYRQLGIHGVTARLALNRTTGRALDGLPSCPLIFAKPAAVVFRFVIQNLCPPFRSQQSSIVFGNFGRNAEFHRR
jgi:hypothetical protein